MIGGSRRDRFEWCCDRRARGDRSPPNTRRDPDNSAQPYILRAAGHVVTRVHEQCFLFELRLAIPGVEAIEGRLAWIEAAADQRILLTQVETAALGALLILVLGGDRDEPDSPSGRPFHAESVIVSPSDRSRDIVGVAVQVASAAPDPRMHVVASTRVSHKCTVKSPPSLPRAGAD